MADDPVPTWPILDRIGRRILGVLVEKAKTTPDAYPLTVNALVTGCNQKSNRDPVMNLDDGQVEAGLDQLREQGLVMLIQSGRTDRWRHLLYDVWTPDKVQMAIITELLLRGPQTEGELRTRASRMDDVGSLEDLRTELKRLAERKLVLYLTPEGRRGTVVTHGFHGTEELDRLRALHSTGISAEDIVPTPVAPIAPPPPSAPTVSPEVVSALEKRLELMNTELNQLKAAVAGLTEVVTQLRRDLGITPSS